MANYTPAAVPNDAPRGLKGFLDRELRRIGNALSQPPRLKPLAAEPDKYQNGDIVYADGSNWDPGSGAGFYGRESGAWVKL